MNKNKYLNIKYLRSNITVIVQPPITESIGLNT